MGKLKEKKPQKAPTTPNRNFLQFLKHKNKSESFIFSFFIDDWQESFFLQGEKLLVP